MRLPERYIQDLDHRITVLMTFTVRRDTGYFGPDHGEQRAMGDLYRGSMEGAGIMLRMLIEFLGLKADGRNSERLAHSDRRDTVLGQGLLSDIAPVVPGDLDDRTIRFLARTHNGASKRSAHPVFDSAAGGLDPTELREATKWVVTQIWKRCYEPDPITIHGDLHRLLSAGEWEGIPFRPQTTKNK